MGPKKGPVSPLTPSTPTPDTPRAMRNKARSQSLLTDSTSSTDPPDVAESRKRAKTMATTQSTGAQKYTWPSFQVKMRKKLRTLHAEWSVEVMRTEISGRWKKYKEDGSLGEGVEKLEDSDTEEEKAGEEKYYGETDSE